MFESCCVENMYALCPQGKGVHNSYMDVYKLTRPVFNGIDPDMPACEARISSKVPSLPSDNSLCKLLCSHAHRLNILSTITSIAQRQGADF